MVKRIESQTEFDEIMKSEMADNITWCEHCGRAYVIDWTDEEIGNMFRWQNRELLIQNALPNRNPYERELMRYTWSGLPMLACSKECDKETFGYDEEDDE